MTKAILIIFSVALALLIGGCMVINVGWNHARIGILSDYEYSTNGVHYVSEDTIGISLRWFPDIDWKALWSKEDEQ